MLLVVTATASEAAPLRDALSGPRAAQLHGVPTVDGSLHGLPIRTAVTGVARAATAFTLSRLLLEPPRACLQFGIGGSFDVDRLALTDVAVAQRDTYADLGVRTEDGWLTAEELGFPLVERGGQRWYATFPCHPEASRAVADELGAPLEPFATVETVTGTRAVAAKLLGRTQALVESMEGAAAAHACLAVGVPFVQVRAASNAVGPRDRAGWRLEEAVRAAAAAALRTLPVLHDTLP